MSLAGESADLPMQTEASARPSMADVGDYLALMKPRVMSLVVFTALVGLVIAPGHLHPVIGFTAILCIALAAGGAGALNMWWEADIDAKMKRTMRRPLPTGAIRREDARDFGLLLSGASVMVMGLAVHWLAAAVLPVEHDRRDIAAPRKIGQGYRLVNTLD